MVDFSVKPIGEVCSIGNQTYIEIKEKYMPAVKALEGYSHINVLWWFSECDNIESRSLLEIKQPYKNAPEVMGIFATRSPERPNPIALTTTEIINIDFENRIIQVAFMDANDKSPILDIKPYTPSFDRVGSPKVPTWCNNWPKSTEASGYFNWESIFNF